MIDGPEKKDDSHAVEGTTNAPRTNNAPGTNPRDEVTARVAEVKKQVGRPAHERKTLARQVDTAIPADTIESFLVKADDLGFSNFKNAVPGKALNDDFDRFLAENSVLIRLALLSYSKIPADWLKKHAPVPSVFQTPRHYAVALMNALIRDEFKLIVEDGAKPSNFYKIYDVFDAMRMVVKYEKEKK